MAQIWQIEITVFIESLLSIFFNYMIAPVPENKPKIYVPKPQENAT